MHVYVYAYVCVYVCEQVSERCARTLEDGGVCVCARARVYVLYVSIRPCGWLHSSSSPITLEVTPPFHPPLPSPPRPLFGNPEPVAEVFAHERDGVESVLHPR